jgi:thioredoxin reductase (NADPH)
VPRTDWLGDQIARSSHGFILSGNDIRKNGNAALAAKLHRTPYLLETNLSGVFVAGDVRFDSVKRVASAVGEGSMAVMYIHRYLNSV